MLLREAVSCPITGSVQVGWGFEQPLVMKDVPPHGREAGLNEL